MPRAYLSLGSNQGDRLETLREAVRLLDARGVRPVRASSVYETAPVGFTNQPAFLNAVVETQTDLDPVALLQATQAVEQALGRTRTTRWGPRTLDVDILLYDDRRIDLPDLTIPHPRMHERRFVLLPLVELDATIEIPGVGLARECLDALPPGTQEAVRVGELVGE